MNRDDLIRTPLLDETGAALIRRLREHNDAPRWNYAVGDRLVRSDLSELAAFREALLSRRSAREMGPPADIVRRFAELRQAVPFLREHVASNADLESRWPSLPTTNRAMLAEKPWAFVPDDVDLERLVIYRTAGTTGHPIEVPHHPRAIACYSPLVECALRHYGVTIDPRRDEAGCFLISAQVKTYTYCTVLSGWNATGFAKINLRPTEWPATDSPRRYCESFSPPLITGEPVAFAELLRNGISARPKAAISTSLAMPDHLSARLRERLGCAVIDWYSMVETGPIAYACRLGNGHHILPHDIHVEVLDADGVPVPEGQRGEVAISGGRNPFLPLFRYRTGDEAAMQTGPCACGDPMPRLVGLQGRSPILFRAADGTPVGAVDVSRLLRDYPILRHRFAQRSDRSCSVVVRPRSEQPGPSKVQLVDALRSLMGELPIELSIDPSLGDDGPVVAYESELEMEW